MFNPCALFFATVMAGFAVSAANSVLAPQAFQAEIILFVGTGRKSPYLCIVNQNKRRKSDLIQTTFFDLVIQRLQ